MPPCRVQSSGWVSVARTPSYACKGVPDVEKRLFVPRAHAGLLVFVLPVSAACTAQAGVPNSLTDNNIAAAQEAASFSSPLVDRKWPTKYPAISPLNPTERGTFRSWVQVKPLDSTTLKPKHPGAGPVAAFSIFSEEPFWYEDFLETDA